MNQSNKDRKRVSSRRDFLKRSTLAAVGGSVASGLSIARAAHPAGSDTIKVGLIGCGSRGTGATADVLDAAPNVKLVAMGDVFPDRIESSLGRLRRRSAPFSRFIPTDVISEGLDVPKERQFVGFDAYQRVIDSEVDYVILTTPPGFRPTHLKAAVAAGKNIFTEKPVAVDGPGIRTCLELYEEANRKKLNIVAGTQRRHQTGYLETMQRVHDGAIGNIVAARCYWNVGDLWVKPRMAGWSDMEWQIRNWFYFTWLSGDHIVEQHVHNLDVVNWAKGSHPVRAMGMGGRQVRVDPVYGHIFDHFAIDYEYEDGTHLMSMCRQILGCEQNVSEALTGDKGFCQADRYTISGSNAWKLEGEDNNPYVQEHTDLIAHIRSGKHINEMKTVAESTMTAIMGRMSAYTGKAVTWEQALNSDQKLGPEKLEWGHLPVPPVAVPGRTEFV